MLGAFRLLLAITVVASHTGLNVHDAWIGVVAVVIFFMISGYAMTALINARFPDPDAAPLFYLERIIRLAPQYYFWLAIAAICAFALNWPSPPLNTSHLVHDVAAYLTVMPLGLQAYLGPANMLLMSQATTLGIEITLYIFSPWIVRSRWLSWMAALTGLAIYAATLLHWLPGNIFTYYNSPGPIIYYMLGSFVFRRQYVSLTIFSLPLIAIVAAGLAQKFNVEFLAGVLIGLPALLVLSRFRQNRFDSMLGDASYGCFLCHGIFVWAFDHFFGVTKFSSLERAAVIALAVAGGFLGYYLVERPTLAFRRRLRTGARLVVSPSAATAG